MVELAGRARRGARQAIDQAGTRITALGGLLESYSYGQVLKRGFVLVRDQAGRPLMAAAETRPGQNVSLRFHDDEAKATITGAPQTRTRRPPPDDSSQGSLL